MNAGFVKWSENNLKMDFPGWIQFGLEYRQTLKLSLSAGDIALSTMLYTILALWWICLLEFDGFVFSLGVEWKFIEGKKPHSQSFYQQIQIFHG